MTTPDAKLGPARDAEPAARLPEPNVPDSTMPALAARSVFGGTLMGLANLVPGVSGGTMLLAAGVYTRFVDAIAEVTTFKFRARSIVTLGCVVGAAAVAIALLAGPVARLVVEHRWAMYALFIGLTLGGVPIIWARARGHHGPTFFAAAIVAFALMGAMALLAPAGGGPAPHPAMFLLGGLAGASAMILPGISGGYLLLLLGQYVPILNAIDQAKEAALGGNVADAVGPGLQVILPVGVGVVVGVVGMSNLIRWLMRRLPAPTFGALLGLVAGAVLGLWPFQHARPPEPGEVIKGVTMTAASIAELDPADYPTERFAPSPGQVAGAAGLIIAGFALTRVIDRFGESKPARL